MEKENSTMLVVGLGNVGKDYEGTRHNIGFAVVDRVADILGLKFSDSKKLQAKIAKGQNIILAKPVTFMNRSGLAVANLKGYYKLDVQNIIIVSDDYNLDLGRVRIRRDGESGGHNGLESVISQLSGGFWRVRFGIGAVGNKKAEDFVLEKFKKDEAEIISQVIDKTAHYLVDLLSKGELVNESINVGPRDV